jgi:hypothetical protein
LSLELALASLEASISVDDDIYAACTKSLSTWDRGLPAVADAAFVCAVALAEMKRARAPSVPVRTDWRQPVEAARPRSAL